MDFDQSSEVIIRLAQEVISIVRRIDPKWNRAFWRFESEECRFGSNMSYEHPSGVALVSAMAEAKAYDFLNNLGRQLWETEQEPDRRFCVCLLVVDSSLNYEVKFERTDMSKWRISKLNGGSGRPAGY